jgi:uncharacterized protein (TIGR02246 family)
VAKFTRDEIEEAFTHYRAVAREAGLANRWEAWADLFTEDATYVEHHLGVMKGRQAILDWITKTMATPPNDQMKEFPVEWYVIDEDKGWVVCCIQNRMVDPGDGRTYEAPNWTLLKYAGDNRWSHEEDIYNPNEFAEMIKAWAAARREQGA